MAAEFSPHLNYWLIALLFLVGIYGIMTRENLLKKLMAVNVLSVAVIAFFLNLAQKTGATPPILLPGAERVQAGDYINPLPHTLMLTAIVVGLATTGVGLALLLRIYRHFGSLEEPEVIRMMRR